MKKLTRILFFTVAISVWAACGGSAPTPDDNTVLTYELFHKDSTSGNVHQALTYPVFKGTNAEAIMRMVVALVEGDSVSKIRTQPSFGDIFVLYAEDMKGADDEMSSAPYDQIDSVMVIYQSPTILCLGNQAYSYMGGAHGSGAILYRTLNPQTGKLYVITDFFKPNSLAELTKIGETCFREQVLPEMELPKTAALTQENGFWFGGIENNQEEGKFYLAKDFSIDKDGFGFVYQQYEIGPYAIGMPSFQIPFAKIKHLLKDEFKNL